MKHRKSLFNGAIVSKLSDENRHKVKNCWQKPQYFQGQFGEIGKGVEWEGTASRMKYEKMMHVTSLSSQTRNRASF